MSNLKFKSDSDNSYRHVTNNKYTLNNDSPGQYEVNEKTASSIVSGVISGATGGAVIGSIAGGVGAVVGAGIGAVVGGVLSNL